LNEAVFELEIACFGLLDDPKLLAQGLVYLLLAQADAGLNSDARATFDRLVEVERDFQGYSEAELPDPSRARLEEYALRVVPSPVLADLAAFRHIKERRDLQTLLAAPPEVRRAELETRLEDDPGNKQWLRLLADLETSEGRPAAALDPLTSLLDQDPGNTELLCERFRSAALADRCDITLADLPNCALEATQAMVAERVLGCIIVHDDWGEAAAFLDTLAPEVRSSSSLRKLDRRVQRELRTLAATTEPPEAEAGDQPAGSVIPTVTPDVIPPDPCETFVTAVRSGMCDQVLAEVSGCQTSASTVKDARAVLQCLVEGQAWEQAGNFLDLLPAGTRNASKIRKLERQVTAATEQVMMEPGEEVAGTGTQPETSAASTEDRSIPPSVTPETTIPPDPCEAFAVAARNRSCDQVLADLSTCQTSVSTVKEARGVLQCLVNEQAWEQAGTFLAVLPADTRGASNIRKLERQVVAATAPTEPESSDQQPEARLVDASDSSGATQAGGAPDPSPNARDMATEAAPDPCAPFRVAARAGSCVQVLDRAPACVGASQERSIAPAVMKCYVDVGAWNEAIAFAGSLPSQVRGLSKIRRLEKRATKAIESQASPEETYAGSDDTAGPSDLGRAKPRTIAEPSAGPSSADLDWAQRIVDEASSSAEITRAYAITGKLAIDYPGHPEAQILAAQGAYRAAQWERAAEYFEASGNLVDAEPLYQLYFAISLFETGDLERAAVLLDLALPSVLRTPFVESYVERIYAAAGRKQ
jgi:hypothetical protein